MKPWKKKYFKIIIKCFKRVKINKWPDSLYSFCPIEYCVRIKWWARPFIQWIYSVNDFLIVTASISKRLHSWLFIDPSERHYTTKTSKFNNLFNRSSTMLNNVFNCMDYIRPIFVQLGFLVIVNVVDRWCCCFLWYCFVVDVIVVLLSLLMKQDVDLGSTAAPRHWRSWYCITSK